MQSKFKTFNKDIWTSAWPSGAQQSPQFWIFREKFAPLTQRHTKGPQFWIFSNIWTSEPCTEEKMVHNFGCFVKYLEVYTTPLRKRSTLCFRKGPKSQMPPPLGDLIKISLAGGRGLDLNGRPKFGWFCRGGGGTGVLTEKIFWNLRALRWEMHLEQ